mmetsp:Transcript_19583/g.60543  ORF Transcript_19583/g.60543 Transcript_19583/m.60543 type:complete len:295 (+) Transcript_19583:1405-2289(+)
MFSTTATTGTFTVSKSWTPLTTSVKARREGVVTTTAASTVRLWQSVSWASPVPGGVSTTSTSNAPQSTRFASCSTTPATRLPRIIAASSFRKPNDMSFRPNFEKGSKSSGERSDVLTRGSANGPISVGNEGPYTSTSHKPTFSPCAAQAHAKLTATVDLPTPPLQLDTATTFFTPLRGSSGVGVITSVASSRGSAASTLTWQSDATTASSRRASRTASVACSQRAAKSFASSYAKPAGSSSSTVNVAAVAVTPLTQPRLTTSESSTVTPRNASTTASRVRNSASASKLALGTST